MNPSEIPLSIAARRVLADVVDQFAHRDEAVRGICAVSEVRQIKHGMFGPAGSVKQGEQPLDDPEANAEEEDLLLMLTGDTYARHELPSLQSNELRIRVVLREPSGEEDEVPSADFTFQKTPSLLVSATVQPPTLAGLAGFLVQPTESKITFQQVNGTPLMSEMRMRMRSRGVGRFRIDQEMIMTARYEPCA